MSVVSGENLNPPIFSNPITTTLTSVPVTAGGFAGGATITYTTPTLQAGATYLVIVNILIDDSDNGLFLNTIQGNSNSETYIIGNNQLLFYADDLVGATAIYVGNTTFQSATPISPLVTQTYNIIIEGVVALTSTPTTGTINPTGSYIQILQLS